MSELRISITRPPCPYCHGPVEPHQVKAACDACLAWHHQECWREHGVCAACSYAEPPLATPAAALADPELEEVREALRQGNPRAAQGLCLELRADERAARRLYEQLLDEARASGEIASARRRNAEISALLVAGEVEEAQARCFEAADEDEEDARRLYEYLLESARERGLLPG